MGVRLLSRRRDYGRARISRRPRRGEGRRRCAHPHPDRAASALAQRRCRGGFGARRGAPPARRAFPRWLGVINRPHCAMIRLWDKAQTRNCVLDDCERRAALPDGWDGDAARRIVDVLADWPLSRPAGRARAADASRRRSGVSSGSGHVLGTGPARTLDLHTIAAAVREPRALRALLGEEPYEEVRVRCGSSRCRRSRAPSC